MAKTSRSAPVVFIVTPGTREANNGNWRTARRWADFLAGIAKPIVQTQWNGEPADAIIALHALRSASSIERAAAAALRRPLAVVLTGTDLYRDLPASEAAMRSLERADRIVTLQDDALRHVPRAHRARCEVVFQSAPPLPAARKAAGRLDCVAVGHLRGEKDPGTLWKALGLLDPTLPVRVRHIGSALDSALGERARDLARRDPRFRWSGALAHGLARAAIRRAHVLVHPSIMEGGANVVIEAVMSGTPVVASRISGNVGLLGEDYPGYFKVGDAAGLARLLDGLARDPSRLGELRRACRGRAALFSPARERKAVRDLVRELLAGARR